MESERSPVMKGYKGSKKFDGFGRIVFCSFPWLAFTDEINLLIGLVKDRRKFRIHPEGVS